MRLTTTAGRAATVKQRKKKAKKAKLPLTSASFTAMDANPEGTDSTTGPPPLLRMHTNPDPTPNNPLSKVNGKKRPFPPSETPTGNSEDLASASASKKRKGNKKKKQYETDGTTSRSQSQSQSRDVSVTSTPQVLTQPLPGVETDAATVAGEKPKKRRKYNRKKKNADDQPAAETCRGV